MPLYYNYSISFNNLVITIGDKLEKIKRIIKDVLTQFHSDLSDVLSTSLEKITIDMYSHGLITETVKDAPNFKDIMTEFQSGINLLQNDQKLVKHCKLFLQTLVNQRGPPSQAANNIAEEWANRIKRELNIAINFNIESPSE